MSCEHNFIVIEWKTIGNKAIASAIVCSKCMLNVEEFKNEINSKQDKRAKGKNLRDKGNTCINREAVPAD